jgi:Spy/CpxP family protein refolding chaperone
MTKTTISLYIALIFLAGAIAGAGVATAYKPAKTLPPRGSDPKGPPRSQEDFQTHIFNRMKDRLALTPEQIEKVEPVFRKGFEEVRAIQDRSIKEVEAAVKKNHEEIGKLITPEQAMKLEEMDREREKSFRERRGHWRGPGRPGPGGPPPGEMPSKESKSGTP